MVLVKVLGIGRISKEFAFENNPTVAEVLAESGDTFVQGNITLGGAILTSETLLVDGSNIFVSKLIKGNTDVFEVKFVKIGSTKVTAIAVEPGTSINAAISTLDEESKVDLLNEDGSAKFEYRVNSDIVDGDSIIPNPTVVGGSVRVIISKKIKGNK